MWLVGKEKWESGTGSAKCSIRKVLPGDKLRIIKAAAQRFVVAATGDGVNDLPALKLASVGITVKNAVDALRSAVDIVLMTSGISVIKDAIVESRKIFMRT